MFLVKFIVSGKMEGAWNVDESADYLRDNNTLILVSLGYGYHDIIRDKLENLKLHHYIFMTEEIVMFLRMEAAAYALKKIGIDTELFNGVKIEYLLNPFIQSDQDSIPYNCMSLKEKMYELASYDSARYAMKNMQLAKMFTNRFELHKWLREEISSKEGLFLEFGVAGGDTINFLRTWSISIQYMDLVALEDFQNPGHMGMTKGFLRDLNCQQSGKMWNL